MRKVLFFQGRPQNGYLTNKYKKSSLCKKKTLLWSDTLYSKAFSRTLQLHKNLKKSQNFTKKRKLTTFFIIFRPNNAFFHIYTGLEKVFFQNISTKIPKISEKWGFYVKITQKRYYSINLKKICSLKSFPVLENGSKLGYDKLLRTGPNQSYQSF